MPNRAVMSIAAIALVCAGGCGEKATTISGKVTYNGQPVEMGAITFTPTDGKGQILAARILDGVYNIPNAMPGSRKVEIRGTKKVNFGRSSEEAARLAAETTSCRRCTGRSRRRSGRLHSRRCRRQQSDCRDQQRRPNAGFRAEGSASNVAALERRGRSPSSSPFFPCTQASASAPAVRAAIAQLLETYHVTPASP